MGLGAAYLRRGGDEVKGSGRVKPVCLPGSLRWFWSPGQASVQGVEICKTAADGKRPLG